MAIVITDSQTGTKMSLEELVSKMTGRFPVYHDPKHAKWRSHYNRKIKHRKSLEVLKDTIPK